MKHFLVVLLGLLYATAQSLPRDPDVPGDTGVAGIDSNKDGGRDDVQRYVFMTYPDENQDVPRTALLEVARSA